MRALLFGGTGQVGAEICTLVGDAGFDLVAPGHAGFDLKDLEAIAELIASKPWDIVINAAAYTDVDAAESNEVLAFAINAEAPARIAAETGQRGVPLIHISTDYVFDGRKGVPYVEQDQIGPLNAYGRSKAAGEHGVRKSSPRHIILRTSWVYSHRRKNFVKTILHLAKTRNQLKIVADQRGCPTRASDIARACLVIAERCMSEPEYAPYGIYHYAGAGEASWFEFATAIINLAGKRLSRQLEVLPIPTRDYPTPAIRPRDTRLDCDLVAQNFDITLQPWQDALADTVDRLLTDKDIS
jgi:dTDP-4-dehydrorhamnose reductase